MNIKQLRQTILDRAIRGQLVSQDPTDEPASVLLERIRAEKEELIKEKKLKREKRESQPIEEVTFEIPEGWVWCRLGEIGIWGSGVTPSRNKKEYYDGNIPWLKTGDLNDSYIYETSELITDLAVKDCSLKKIPIGSVLIAMYGATIAKLGLLEIEVTINQACCACTPFSGIVNKFLFYYLFSQKQNIKDKAEGGAQPNISKEKLINFPFPLPPLKEQHRIVQKIEQLFALVDIIEVNKKALEKLIERAKSQVLNDAVAGKLTHQDPNDEPAEELLKRIGKTTAPDTPYEKMLPKGWAWCKLG
ncbi:restriction endonuclease subunit S, partial [Capnocytophaga leadbetteri]